MRENNLKGSLKDIIDRYPDEYYIGSIGHDILYWADYLPGDQSRFLKSDPHTYRSGELILNLLDDYIERKDALKKESPATESGHREIGDEEKSLEKYLAFILGWVTHWTTDLYIHTLTDWYGGIYTTRKGRHIQLELVETKYLYEKVADLKNHTIRNNDEVWSFFSRPMRITYPDARIKVSSPAKTGEKTGTETVEVLPDARPDLFCQYIKDSLNDFMIPAWDCANESCNNATGKLPFRSALSDSARAFFNVRLPSKTLAELGWSFYGARIPSKKCFEDICEPLQFISVKPRAEGVDVEVHAGDTGLYGKFLSDYELFSAAAIMQAGSVIGIIEEKISSIKDVTALRQILTVPGSPMTGLEVFLNTRENTVNILVPEGYLSNIDRQFLDMFSDGTIRNGAAREPEYRNRLYYELEYVISGKSSRKVTGYVPVVQEPGDNLFDSVRGTAEFSIDLPVTGSSGYSFRLTVSLTDNMAFSGDRPEPGPAVNFNSKITVTPEGITISHRYERVEFLSYEGTYAPGPSRYILFFDNGNKREEGDWNENDRERNGHWSAWWENGSKREDGYFKNDRRHGHWVTWFEDGSKESEGEYLDGKQAGHWTMWYGNGKKREEGDYINGEKNNHWITYYMESGAKQAEGDFRNGTMTGRWIYWNEDGSKKSEKDY